MKDKMLLFYFLSVVKAHN